MRNSLAILASTHLNQSSPRHLSVGTLRINESIKRYLAPVTVLQQVNFYLFVQAAMKVEKSEASSRERFQKRKLSKGASSSSSKRARESQTESVHSSATLGRRQGNTVVPSTGRGASTGLGETPKCPHCY